MAHLPIYRAAESSFVINTSYRQFYKPAGITGRMPGT